MKTYILIAVLTLGIIGCKEQTISDKNHYPTVPIKQLVLDSLNHPWSITFISEDEALISEKDGNLLRVNLESKEKKIIKGFPINLTDSIRAIHFGDNSGIFEVLVDPDFKNDPWVYVSYAAKKGFGTTTKVIRAQLKNDSLTNHKTLIEAAPYTREYFHYGGGMTFGTDGKLYVTIGERLFWERDEPEIPIAQDVTDKRGKIYRINPDGSIPEDNPDFGNDAVPGLYAMGIRAAQGITVEPKTGNIWFSEHGTIQGDEVNILKAGANYGWPNVTSGKLRSKDYTPPKIEGAVFTAPIWFWPHTVAPTGLIFYTGNEFPEWKDNLIVPGLSRGSLWRFRIENDTIKSAEELFIDDRVRSRKVMQSPEGKLYMLTDEDNGKLLRILPKPNNLTVE
ncbi:PQQ-dependent sugar dehydrogenase [Flagellimonas sp. HMM57]|uniref:PQQ-dependent sugar dehydrogenase n=1 Tax=unclassified Flagellimonas TaxID=2644544 RepID=UPI001969B7EF|nr:MULTISPECIES: PQQ-dependent sugar dehydrogenase [unclassified Flagellimonas]UII77471.1 PQQ-dependent sugar dehydrogenase [Flagellimonas sp. HMM57]